MKQTDYLKEILMDRFVGAEFIFFGIFHSNCLSLAQLQTIFESLPEKKQTLLFSATITDTLCKLREVALSDVSSDAFI